MADAWKDFEAYAASLFGTRRAWANSGERVDFPHADDRASAWAVGQCKNVKTLSLNELTHLAEEMAQIGLAENKLGVVCAKVRRGRGRESATLVVMTDRVWKWLLERHHILFNIQQERERHHGNDPV